MDIRKLRRRLREQRRALSSRQQQQAASALLQHIARQPWFRNSRRLAFFMASDGEIDPSPLMTLAAAAGKACYLPVLHPLKFNRLYFVRHQPGERLPSNRFGIPEPPLHHHRTVPAWSLDVIFMPLVGFDRTGNRIGMGGGFYDRTLAFVRQRHRATPRLVGLAHAFQQVETLAPQPWDIPLHYVATDEEVLSCAPRHTHPPEDVSCARPESSPP